MSVQLFNLTPRESGAQPSPLQLLGPAIPWILLAVTALWALRH
jgi:hypothetical protein